MTRDDIIRMAVKCQLINAGNREGLYMNALAEFADLVAAAEREAFVEQVYEAATKAAEAGIAKAMELEREACAQICELHKIDGKLVHSNAAVGCAAAIRRRGQQ